MVTTTAAKEYIHCLIYYPVYASIWIAECVKQAGNWFTFIAAYTVIARLSPFDAATHTALFLICRRLPYLLLFPVTGLAADRLNRGALLVARQDIWLLYPLIFCQYCAQAFYDPARAAAIPSVVPRRLICVSGTLDTLGFSLMALGGAALAGNIAARYGPAVCFRIEGVAFILAAVLTTPLASTAAAAVAAAHCGSGGGGGRSGATRRRSRNGVVSITAATPAGLLEAEAPPELQPLLTLAPPSLGDGVPRKERPAAGGDEADARVEEEAGEVGRRRRTAGTRAAAAP
ncbi:hypothetical protein HYH02_015422 [Chlamydomonas schloesseri]|uniref:Uncharacterized protein n=1 Tax=Chlamydomonas schloesseri TaxID=2026947 RepID=A0A835SKW6_9CHLO|nr:hypothetical protein HYH02_015422 [Chlamydomonas schloesseri]|eukprot:KAG2422535.1 hypothetical protein HYH02_015422 [Chlamydomonas schloesseri]